LTFSQEDEWLPLTVKVLLFCWYELNHASRHT
jgi:hypothetical protein